MEQHNFPEKRDWLLLGVGAFLCLSSCSEQYPTTPKIAEIPAPLPQVVLQYEPTVTPAILARRLLCQDRGAYTDKKLNFACGQEKHQ